MSYDADGRFQLRYSAPATVGALVVQAVREAKDALFLRSRGAAADGAGVDDATSGSDGDGPASGTGAVRGPVGAGAGLPTYADALEEMAVRSLAAVASTSRAAHYRVYLHLDTDGAWVSGGHAIPLRLLGRFVSDGVVQPVWETEGKPVSVGRAMRILPERSRRLVVDRDRGCRFPGCTSTRFVEVHHLDAWADGGRTDLDNQVSLCTVHHDASTAATTSSAAIPPGRTASWSPTGTACPFGHHDPRRPRHHRAATRRDPRTASDRPAEGRCAGATSRSRRTRNDLVSNARRRGA